MDDRRITPKMEQLLNAQMTREAYQAQVYLSYGSWAEVNSFNGILLFYINIQEKNANTCLNS